MLNGRERNSLNLALALEREERQALYEYLNVTKYARRGVCSCVHANTTFRPTVQTVSSPIMGGMLPNFEEIERVCAFMCMHTVSSPIMGGILQNFERLTIIHV
jgi:hypothetical protein